MASTAQWAAIAGAADDDKLGAIIEVDIFIPSPREAVFRFFVDPALVAEWLGEAPTLDAALAAARIDIELVVHREGTLVQLVSRDDEGDAPRRFWTHALAKLYAAALRRGRS